MSRSTLLKVLQGFSPLITINVMVNVHHWLGSTGHGPIIYVQGGLSGNRSAKSDCFITTAIHNVLRFSSKQYFFETSLFFFSFFVSLFFVLFAVFYSTKRHSFSRVICRILFYGTSLFSFYLMYDFLRKGELN